MKNKLLAILRNKIFISTLGMLALIALIWFGGPYLGFGDSKPLAGQVARMVVILIIVVLWGLSNLFIQMRATRANAQMMQSMSTADAGGGGADAGNESREEIAQLKERFDESMAVLKKAGGNLYELPWYIIIGPPGSGKTTALVNSGLNFPLADRFGREAVRGVGGTRNCDWWFTEEAILLDTAGRYVTQDSHAAVDSAAWGGFLDLLKKHRRRRPINGVMVAISLADLLMQTEQEHAAHIRAIKARIQELSQHLGIKFPVYVLFTKSDLVAGFMEFFDDLGREEREQVWGMTFPMDDPKDSQGVVHLFSDEFEALLSRVNDRLLMRLNQERDVKRRALMYGFPQQMAALKQTAVTFLEEIFRPSRFEDRPLLRGVYFTSGTQEGTPIDRLMGSLASNFGLDRQVLPSFAAGRGRSYFITRLYKNVIFGESGMAGADRRFERQRAWIQRGSYIGALGATLLAALAWSTSCTRNEVYVSRMQDSAEAYQKVAAETPRDTTPDFSAALPALNAARATTDVYREHQEEGSPWLMGMGLYQGDKLAPAAHDAYRRELQANLLPRIGSRLEDQMRAGAGNPDFQYEALKTYLMLGDHEHLDPELVKLWMSLDWQATLPGEAEKQEQLQQHLNDLLAEPFTPLKLDDGLVEEVRYTLNQVPVAQRIYGRLKKEAMTSDVKGFRVSEVGNGVQKVYSRASGASLDEPIPGLFTQEGFYKIFMKESLRLTKREAEEAWVLGNEAVTFSPMEIEKITGDVRELYLDDYIRQWDGLLNDLEVAPFSSMTQAVSVLDTLSAPTSPMRGILQAVERNTQLNRGPGGMLGGLADKAGAALEQKADAAVDAEKARLARLMQGATPSGVDVNLPSVEGPGSKVARHFERINGVVASPGGAPPIDGILNVLSEVYGYLGSMAGSGNAAEALRGRTSGGSDAIRRLQIEAARQPEPLKRWLQSLAQNSVGVMMGGTRSQLNAAYQSMVVPHCTRGLNNRYPLVRSASQEVNLSDFGRFFGPGGVMDEFFQSTLKPFVDTSRRTWAWKSSDGQSLGLSNAVLQQFQRAALIQEMFFADGGQRPLVRFGLKPVFLDANVSQFMIDLDGQRFTYRHGPTVVSNAQWPGPDGSTQTRIEFEEMGGGRVSDSADGPWAWFRILDKARISSSSRDRLEVTFEINGRKAIYELRANSVVNPFLRQELESFRCPSSL